MAGPGGQVVGKISVRVLPDTSEFKEDAKAKLKRIENGLPKVKVQATFSDTGLRSAVLQSVREINATAASSDAYKIRLKATIANTTAENRKAVNDARKAMQDIAKTTSNIKLKADLLVADIDAKLTEKSLDGMTRDLENWRRKNNPVKMEVELNMNAAASRYVSQRLSVIGRNRTVWFNPAMNSAAASKVATALAALAGARVIDDLFRKFKDFFSNIDKNLPLIGSLGLAIMGLAGSGLAGASNLFALSQSLAMIAPLALTLPGIFGGIALGLGATVAVLKDFNKVLPEVSGLFTGLQDKMSKNFWGEFTAPMRELISTLFPSFSQGMQEVSTQLGGWFAGLAGGLGSSLGPLMDSMFQNLSTSIDIATTATGGLANIIAVLGSVGAAQLPQFAQWFADITNGFSAWLTQANDSGQIMAWIEVAKANLADLGNILRFTGVILADIAAAATAAGGSGLASMADMLERVAAITSSEGFQTGLTNTLTAAHEAMNTISQTSGASFFQFWQTLADLFQGVLPIAGAALGTAFNAIFSAMNQPAVSAGIIALFTGINTAISAIAPAMEPMGAAFGALMTVLGTFAATIGPTIGVVFTGLSQALLGLMPAIGPLVEMLGGALTQALAGIMPAIMALIPVIMSIIAAIMPIVEAILPVIVAVITQVVTALAPLIATMAGALIPVLNAILPVIDFLANLIGAILVPVLIFIAGIITDMVVGAFNGLQNIIEGVMGFFDGFMTYMDGFVMVWSAIWTLFTEGPAAAWEQVLTGLRMMWEGFKEMISSFGQAIVGALEVLWNVGIVGSFSKGAKAVKSLWDDAWKAIKKTGEEFWDAIKAGFGKFFDNLGETPGKTLEKIKTLMKDAWELIKITAQTMWDDVVKAVADKFGGAIQAVDKIITGIKDVFANPKEFLKAAGKKIIEGLIDGIKDMFGKVKETLKGLTDMLPDWKGPAPRDRKVLVGAGQMVMDGFLKGLEDRYAGIRKSLRGFTNDLAGEAYGANITAGFAGNISGSVGSAMAGGGSSVNKTFNYYAAQGSSLGSEEDLFTAMGRGRAVGF